MIKEKRIYSESEVMKIVEIACAYEELKNHLIRERMPSCDSVDRRIKMEELEGAKIRYNGVVPQEVRERLDRLLTEL